MIVGAITMPGLAKTLKSRRQVRRLADDGFLLGQPLADQVANHDMAGGDSTRARRGARPAGGGEFGKGFSEFQPKRTARSASSSCAWG